MKNAFPNTLPARNKEGSSAAVRLTMLAVGLSLCAWGGQSIARDFCNCRKSGQPVIYTLQPGERDTLTVVARERCSRERVQLAAGGRYIISCDTSQEWKDWTIRTCALGFNNRAANFWGKRVDTCTFALCGAYNDRDERAFYIGAYKPIEALKDDVLYFFANDVKGFEWNNKGSLQVVIYRER